MNTQPTAIAAALRLLHQPGATFEIRIPNPRTGFGTTAGYFSDYEAAAKAAANWSGKASAVYVTLNPARPDLLARSANRLRQMGRSDHTTSDGEIVARRWFPIDLDPVRPSGISSTEAEHAAAIVKAREIRQWLTDKGWPKPVLADSGNGAHLLYRIDLPNDADSKSLCEAGLKALSERFTDQAVTVDSGVFNASRIWKLYGTAACKGDHTPERPHRNAAVLEQPAALTTVPIERLQALAALAPKPEPAKPRETERRDGGDFFDQVNAQAMRALPDWVPALFPTARPYQDGYRVPSKALGRDLEEDLSILPIGIKDFGVHDQGDPRNGCRTPLDLVIEHRGLNIKDAAFWLCGQMGIQPSDLGWNERKPSTSPPKPSSPPAEARYLDSLGSREPPKPSTTLPPIRPFTEDELSGAKLHPRCIVDQYLYADLALVAAAGGTGKTTTLLYEAVCIATGRDLWGNRVWNPGATLFITAEDSRELFAARLREIMNAMNLSPGERVKALSRVTVWDVSSDLKRLAELDQGGNIRLTTLADDIVAAYKDAGLVQVVFDPAISFGPGERLVNDGEQSVVTACRRIVRGLNCCVRLIHHTGKANARNGAIDQYASRGGTALPDGCRMVAIMSSVGKEDIDGKNYIHRPEDFELNPGESGFILARAKLSYAPPQPNIWVRRNGYAFDYFVEMPNASDKQLERDADKVEAFLSEELARGKKYSANQLETSGKIKLSRARTRTALTELQVSKRVVSRNLPKEECHGGLKTYLYPAKVFGEVSTQSTLSEGGTSPPSTTSPPYREYNGGEVTAAVISPILCTSPKSSGEVAAKWRGSEDSPAPLLIDGQGSPPLPVEMADAVDSAVSVDAAGERWFNP